MASRSVNKVFLVGNLGRDAETKFTPSGVACTRFSVASTRSWKDQQTNEWKEETNWTKVTAWRKENLANYLTKGKQVHVEGRLQTRSYDKDGQKVYATEVIAEDIILLGGNRDEQSPSSSQPPRNNARKATNGTGASRGSAAAAVEEDAFDGTGITDDDIPF